ncbi:MAG: C40 family peptidase [Trebonia sp.]
MRASWRHWAAAGGRQIAALGVAGVLGVIGPVGAAATASDGVVTQAAVRPTGTVPKGALGKATVAKNAVTPGGGQLSAAQNLVAGWAAALARSKANTATLAVALSGLRTQGEVLTERYDREVSLAQQAATAYQVAVDRVAAAKKQQQRAVALLGRQAAADYEWSAGQSVATVLFAGITDPQGYLGTLGLQQAQDDQSVDLLAETKADALVTRLFSEQAAELLGQQRAAEQSASFLRSAVIAAVNRQAAVVKAARTTQSRLAAETAAAQAALAARTGGTPLTAANGTSGPGGTAGSGVPPGVAASVLAGGPGGAAPGVNAPDWAPDAGASAAQGGIAANWALSQLGKPYQWGAAGPDSYDCSGLALRAWARAGVRLLHWTGYQWVSGPHVPLGKLRRGDLIFFAYNIADPATIHHVGIYIGNGLMVDAPYTGAFVEIDSIYRFGGLIGATRPAS